MKKEYRVTYRQDERGWWIAAVPEIAGCHTQGRSLATAMHRVVEAVEVSLPEGAAFDLTHQFALGPAGNAVERLRSARDQYEAASAAYSRSNAEAIAQLARTMSTRDASAILRLSHQRVQQVTAARAKVHFEKVLTSAADLFDSV